MNFVLDADQLALRDGIRSLLRGRFPMDVVRTFADEPGAVDRARWRELAEAGVFSLRVPEADGGVGVRLIDAAIVFEELGAALVPGPLVWSELAAASIDGVAGGDVVVTGLDLPAQAPAVLANLEAADVVVFLDDVGVRRIDPPAIDATALTPPLDPLTPVHRVAATPDGEPLFGSAAATTWFRDGAVLSAALAVGVARGATDLGVAYAKEREQFGRAIGGFQAVKHLLADAAVRVEVARAAVHAAALTLEDPAASDSGRVVAGARHLASEAAVADAHTCLQVHGGIGFTWEADVHLYLKRAWVLQTAFGSSDEHAEAVARSLT